MSVCLSLSVFLSVRLSVRNYELSSHWTDFYDISYWDASVKICRESSDLAKVVQKYRILYMKALVDLIFLKATSVGQQRYLFIIYYYYYSMEQSPSRQAKRSSVRKCPAFYGTGRCITASTRARQLSLS
jgi:hypothetical protein